ncbi:MAG: gluconate 2-dehydrogenase subunit 3 family protein [Gemmatimonadales bacterium]
MHRRDLLRFLGSTALLPFVPRSADRAFAFGQAVHRASAATALEYLTPAEAELVTTIADLILPRTETPGASDVGVTPFIDHLLAHWYKPEDSGAFRAGLAAIDQKAGGRFTALDAARQATLLASLDQVKGDRGSAEAEFGRLKSLVIYGYFTSELVVKTVTKDPIIPGKFEGCVPAR